MSFLSDQFVTQGDSLTYFFGQNTNFFGTETPVNVGMREATIFSTYDQTKNAFAVDGAKIPDILIGMHKITVEATYLDPKGQTQFFSESFFLHVKAAASTEEGD